MTELFAVAVFAVGSFILARRSIAAHDGGLHVKYPTRVSRAHAIQPQQRHRGLGHVSSLVRYIATGAGPYAPPE